MSRFLVIASLLLYCLAPLGVRAAGVTAQGLGLTLEALSADELDATEQVLGQRVGVLVRAVTPQSAAAKAGLRTGDLLFVIGKQGVDSPQAVDAALAGLTGVVDVMGARQNGEQYDVVKVSLSLTTTPTPAVDPSLQEKLQALDAARAAGILTEKEYAEKKAALEKQGRLTPEIDEETQRKLKTLDTAHALGVLSDAEYEQKKQALLKSSTLPAPAVTLPVAPAEKISDPTWGWGFVPPAGWKHQQGPQGVALGHDTIAGLILVLPHTLKDKPAIKARMQQGLSDPGLQLTLNSAIEPLGETALLATYDGVMQGTPVKVRIIGTASPHGGGAFIAALAQPDKFTPPLAETVVAIARAMRYVKSDVSDLARHFSGTWTTYNNGATKRVTLALNGTFFDNSEASFFGNLIDPNGNVSASYGAASQTQASGKWTVKGSTTQGVLTLTFANGQVLPIPYTVHYENGRATNAYEFGGILYGRE